MQSRLRLRVWESSNLPRDWAERTREPDDAIEKNVEEIVNEVKNGGDAALTRLTLKFDRVQLKPESLRASSEEIQQAYTQVSEEQIAALKLMKERLSAFEKMLLKQIDVATLADGITIQNMLVPLDSVGCYVPGGQASYPSTLIMTTAPAKSAGVKRIAVCSPPNEAGIISPIVLVAADIAGVDEIYKVGGAQAIAALAYGTETIKPVRKIVGPGNRYVTAAKVLVSKSTAVDMPAGPSEVLVLTDETANEKLVVADMISQAEHGEDSVAGLITTSKEFASKVLSTLDVMLESAERKDIVEEALSKFGFVITCDGVEGMVSLANSFAPEHLEIMTKNPVEIASKITSAGLILIGSYSPVALSDYASGTNHVLPTGGFARTYSGLSALDFVRRVSVVESSREGLMQRVNDVKVLAEAENLPNHRKAVEARFEDERQM